VILIFGASANGVTDPALVHARRQLRREDLQHGQGLVQVAGRKHPRLVQHGQRRGIGDMVEVAVRDQDKVDLAELFQVFVLGGCGRVRPDPWIDHDDLAAGRGEPERGLSEPEQLGLAGLGECGSGGQQQGHAGGQSSSKQAHRESPWDGGRFRGRAGQWWRSSADHARAVREVPQEFTGLSACRTLARQGLRFPAKSDRKAPSPEQDGHNQLLKK
jgi:hypothetical protein